MQTGCLILSDNAKSYREESTGCSGNQDRAHQGVFPRGGITLSMKGGGHYPGQRQQFADRRASGKAGKWKCTKYLGDANHSEVQQAPRFLLGLRWGGGGQEGQEDRLKPSWQEPCRPCSSLGSTLRGCSATEGFLRSGRRWRAVGSLSDLGGSVARTLGGGWENEMSHENNRGPCYAAPDPHGPSAHSAEPLCATLHFILATS